jgi:hypothetical protein
MSKYVSINVKYYKEKNNNLFGHNERTHKKVESSKPELKAENITFGKLGEAYYKTKEQVEKKKGKAMQSNSNTYIDALMSFGRDQTRQLIAEHGREKAFEMLKQSCKEYMIEFRTKFGFEPLAFQIHVDEGHYDKETGEWKENFHAHLQFFNYDFKTGKAPLRNFMGKSGKFKCSKMQDLAGAVFKDLGYIRGESAEVTKKKHLEKEEFVAQKIAKKVEKYNALLVDIDQAANQLSEQVKEVDRYKAYHDAYIKQSGVEMDEATAKIEAARASFTMMKEITDAALESNQNLEDLAMAFDEIRAAMNDHPEIGEKLKAFWDELPKELSEKVEKKIDLLCIGKGVEPIFDKALQEQIKNNFAKPSTTFKPH